MVGNNHLILIVVALFCLASSALGQVEPAPPCTDDISENVCLLPTCRCSGTTIPGDLIPSDVPQLVFLTFDDAVSLDNYAFYENVLFNRRNPNGEPITATFFISHEYTNYSMVHDLWRLGHNIGLHSISHNPNGSYWANLDEEGWRQEMVDQREQIAAMARIPASSMLGVRATFLRGGGDTMYKVLSDNAFVWESSRSTFEFRNPGLWPYTNDYASTQDCRLGPCPVGSYPGLWTVPMIEMWGEDDEGCAMLDTCIPVVETEDEMYNLLRENFHDHYNGNRAPFGIYTHSAFLNGTGGPVMPGRRLGYAKFLDYLATLDDVYIVSVDRGLEWVKTPTPLANITVFEPFKVVEASRSCEVRNCLYPPELTPFPFESYLATCTECPPRYPWVGNHLGEEISE